MKSIDEAYSKYDILKVDSESVSIPDRFRVWSELVTPIMSRLQHSCPTGGVCISHPVSAHLCVILSPFRSIRFIQNTSVDVELAESSAPARLKQPRMYSVKVDATRVIQFKTSTPERGSNQRFAIIPDASHRRLSKLNQLLLGRVYCSTTRRPTLAGIISLPHTILAHF